MLSFKELSEKKKKTNILINPKKTDLQEKNHGEDCDCPKCEKKRRSEDVNDGPDIATEEACGKGMYYCHDDKKCKPIPKGYKEGKDGMLVKEAKYEAGASDYGKMSIRNKRAVGYGGNAAPPEERRKAHAERMKKHKKEDAEVYWSSKALDQLDEINAKERMKRDAGAIAKKKMRNKEHKKYVNFLDVDENTIHSFNTFIQNNKPYDSQKEVSEESDKESKVETSLLKFSECWKTHKKVGMKMKGGKLVNDCRPKTASDYKKEEVEIEEKVYTGPDKKDRAVIKKMDNPSYAKKLADYEKNMDPKKRQALKDKATKGMKFTHEETLSELKMPKDTKYHKMSYKDLKKTHKDFKNMDSTPPRVTTLDKKTNATVSRPVKFVPDKKKTNEAANPAQQAAIAIDMKKKGKKPKDVQEATRLKKEMGYDKGGTKKPTAPKQKDTALDLVKKSITAKYGKGAIMSGGSRQQKKVKGEKDTRGTGKFKKAADAKKQTASDAKKRGFKDVKSYVNTMARYGGKDNYDKGKGLGT